MSFPPPPPSDGGPPPPPPGQPFVPPPGGALPPQPPQPPQSEERRRSLLLLWLFGAVIAVGGGVAVVLALTGGDDPVAAPSSTAAPDDSVSTTIGPVGDGTTPTTAGPPPGIDPAINWRQVDPMQFLLPGEQRINDVVVHAERLVAGGTSLNYRLPEAVISLSDGGGPVSVADWEIAVTAVNLDASADIAAFDAENEPAPEGFRYIMVTLQVTNQRDETRQVLSGADLTLWGPDERPVAEEVWCGTLPESLRGRLELGESMTGNVCLAMLEEDFGDGLVLGVTVEDSELGDWDASVWTSEDGETWSRGGDPDLEGAGVQTITRMAVFDGWVYAIGRAGEEDRDGAIWRSGDGTGWDRLDVPALGGPGDQFLTDLMTADGRLYIGGSTELPLAPGEDTSAWNPDVLEHWQREAVTDRGALWVSDDGLAWETIVLEGPASGLAHVDKVVAYQGRLKLLGTHVDGQLAMVSSSGGGPWESIALPAYDMSRWGFSTAEMVGDRMYVLGTGSLMSTDGITWETGGGIGVIDATPAGEGLLAVGAGGGWNTEGPIWYRESRPVMRVLDGSGVWHHVRGFSLLADGEFGDMSAVVLWQNRFVAVGMATANGTDDAAVWIGGGPEGSAVPDLAEADVFLPDPPVQYPTEPTGDLVQFDGANWEVLDLGQELTPEAEESLDVYQLFTEFIARDGDGGLWAASRREGVFLFDGNGWTEFDLSHGLPSLQVWDLDTDADGTVWAGTAAGPAYFDGMRWQAGSLPSAITLPHVTELAADADGSVWVATLSGLVRWDGATWTPFTMDDGLPSSVVTDVQIAAGGVWAMTPAGIGHWDGSSWVAFMEPEHRPYYEAYPYASPLDTALYFAPGSDRDAGDHSEDVWRLEPGGSVAVQLADESTYKDIALAPDGTLYVATDINGLFVVGPDVQNVDTIEGVRLIHIGDLWTAPTGDVWMNAAKGLFQIHQPGIVTRHTEVSGLGYTLIAPDEGFADGAVIDLVFGPGGEVWAFVYAMQPER